jgi:energy-coupling factor transporter ATP-binding protein EcfA2
MAAITSLKIQNFRIFDQEGSTFDLAPLTFLTGCNSSGKSSIVKALILLSNFAKNLRAQYNNTGDFNLTNTPLGLQANNLQLGDFSSVLNHSKGNDGCLHFSYTYKHSFNTPQLNVELTFSSNDQDFSNDAWLKLLRISTTNGDVIVEVDTQNKSGSNIFNPIPLFQGYAKDVKNLSNQWDMLPHVIVPMVAEDNLSALESIPNIKKYMPIIKKHVQSGIVHYCPIFLLIGDVEKSEVRRLLAKYISKKSILENIINDFENSNFDTFNKYYAHLETLSDIKNINTKNSHCNRLINMLRTSIWCERAGDLEDFSSMQMDEFYDDYVNRAKKIDLEHVSAKMMQLSWRDKRIELPAEVVKRRSDVFYDYEGLHPDDTLFNPIYNMFVTYVINIIRDSLLFNKFSDCQYIPSISSQVQRLYTFDNNTSKFGDILLNYKLSCTYITYPSLQERGKDFINKWLREFEIAHHFEICTENSLGVTIYLYKEQDSKGVLLADYGFGITQLFAILLTIATNAVYTSYPRVIAIEEPENHLHPAFQSKLADMFYEAHKEFNLSFIIETHSEYLIRKTQVIVANAYAANDKMHKPFFDDGIPSFYNPFKVYYIPINDKHVSKYKKPYEMIYRKDGNFENEFGLGFYDEATNLAFQTL